jgi:hypothetical protein
VAASSQGLIGRGLGSTIPSSRNAFNQQSMPSTIASQKLTNIPNSPTQPIGMNSNSTNLNTNKIDGGTVLGGDYLEAARMMSETTPQIQPSSLDLAPRSQTVAAVAEEEWEKRGIGFKTQAERGTGFWDSSVAGVSSSGASGQVIGGGSLLLADLIQQNLIHDQYDRVVMEQDQEIQAKMDKAEANARSERKKP